MSITANANGNDLTKEKPHYIKRIGCDLISGFTAGFSVAPFVTIIDKGITQNASGANTLWKSIGVSTKSFVFKPAAFIVKPEFRWIFAVYFSTYSSANLISTFCTSYNINPDFPKFIGVSVVNLTMSISKDRAFARLFGTKTPEKVPMKSITIWCVRDCLTILCAFVIPPKMSSYMQRRFGMKKGKSDKISQIFCPVLLQVFSTPLHLLGLDIYNNRNSNLKNRISFIRREYVKSCCARMMRILPAFGLGGIANGIYREYFNCRLI